MKYPFLLALLFLSCASTQPVVPPAPVTQTIYIHDTTSVTVTKYDTTVLRDTTTNWVTVHDTVNRWIAYPVPLFFDTTIATVLEPSGGDDWPQLQAAINSGEKLRLSAGLFHISRALLVLNLNSGQYYGQAHLDMEGAEAAQDAPATDITIMEADFTNGPVLALQQCKGCRIANISFQGQYKKPMTLTQLQIDTLTFEQWADGICRTAPTSPQAGVVIDPFSDPVYLNGDTTKMYPGLVPYYLPGMSRSGSTAVTIDNCAFEGFVVGILVTAVNQQNGELVDITNDRIDYCRSAIAQTQAQSKQNIVSNLMCWGGTRHIIDCIHYGLAHGDGATAPKLFGANIAGFNYELIAATDVAFPITVQNVYSEGLFKIGWTGAQYAAGAGVDFRDCQFDLQLGGPSPDYWYHGAGTTFGNCVIRYYNGTPQRIVLNDQGDLLQGGSFGAPVVQALGMTEADQDVVAWPGIYYPQVGQIWSDSIAGGAEATIHIDRSTFTGWLLMDTTGLSMGTLLLTTGIENLDGANAYQPVGYLNWQTPLGYVSRINADTVFLVQTGMDVHDLDYRQVWKCVYK